MDKMRAFYQKYELLSMIIAGMQIMRRSPPATLKNNKGAILDYQNRA